VYNKIFVTTDGFLWVFQLTVPQNLYQIILLLYFLKCMVLSFWTIFFFFC